MASSPPIAHLCVVLLVLGLAGIPACSPESTANGGASIDVLFLTIDTLTADRVGVYGCPDVRTPAIDRLARNGLQVRDAIAPTPLTLPSHATMLTGVDPPTHGVRDNGLFTLKDSFTTVPELLPTAVRRAAFVGAYPLARRFNLAQGFDRYDDAFLQRAGPLGKAERRARAVYRRAAEWFEKAGPLGSFAWVHVFDPHFPYSAPGSWPRLADLNDRVGPYECEVAYTDRELWNFQKSLEEFGHRDVTILLTSDHGESLGRHRENTHGFFVYDATQRVPLILSGPGVPRKIESTVRPLVDVAPTLLSLFSRGPAEWHTGISLLQERDDSAAWVENRSTEFFRGWASLYGVRTSEWKYVRAPRPELYDLIADPGETVNVHDEYPDVAAALSAKVDDVLAGAEADVHEDVDEDVLEKLQSLGYLVTLVAGAEAHPEEDPKDHVEGVVAMFQGQEAFAAGDYEIARKYLERALELDPDLKRAHSYLSGACLQLGDLDACARHGLRFLELPPALFAGPVHATLGEAYLRSGRIGDALRHLDLAVAANAEDLHVQELVAEAWRRIAE